MSEFIGYLIGMLLAVAAIYVALWIEDLWDHRKYTS